MRRKHEPADLFRAAASRRRAVFDEIRAQLDAIDARLLELDSAIRAVQRRTHGAITLQFKLCSRACLGCPHPIWLKWVDPSKQKRRGYDKPAWYAAPVSPSRRIGRGEAAKARELILEAVALIRRRHETVKLLSSLNARSRQFRKNS